MSPSSFRTARRILCGSILGALLCTQSPVEAADPGKYNFATASKPLAAALDDFSRVTGYDVAARTDALRGKTAPAVSGDLSPEAALSQMLAGSGLSYRMTGPRTVAIVVPAAPLAAVAEEGTTMMPEVVVSGVTDGVDGVYTRDRGSVMFGETNLRETPFSINVIGEEEIVRHRAANLGDVLALDPATSPTYYSNGVIPVSNWGMVRGFHNNKGFVDGTPIIDNDLSQIEMLERVEVLRGPGSFRYGFVAPGGVVSLTTKRPTPESSTQFHSTYDSWGMVSGHLDTSHRLGKEGEFGYRINLAGNSGGSWAGDSFTERYLGGLSLEYRLSDRVTLSGNFSYSHFRVDNVSWGEAFYDINGKQLPVGPEEETGPGWRFQQGNVTRGFVRMDAKLTDNLDLVMSFGTNRADWNYRDFWVNDIEPNGDTTTGGRNVPGEHNYTYGNTTYFNLRLEHGPVKHTLTAGIMLEKSTVEWSMEGYPDLPWNVLTRPKISIPTKLEDGDYGYEVDGYQYGGFLSDQVDFGEDWHGVVGLRYTRVESTFSERFSMDAPYVESPEDVTNAFSWMVGLLYDVTDQVGVYASVATGVEPGERAPNDATNPGELLGPIESFQVEAGFKWTLKENVATVDANFFYITRGSQFYEGPGTEFRDAGEQRHVGAELMFNGRFWKPLVLAGGLQYLDASLIDAADPEAEGDRPIGVPIFQAVLDATLDIEAVPGLAISGTVFYTGDRELSSPNTDKQADAYTRLDLGASYAFTAWKADWKLSARVENVFDDDYIIGDWAVYGSPRTLMVGLDVKF